MPRKINRTLGMIFRGDKNALQDLVEELNERSDVELVYFETDTEHLYISHEKTI